MKRLTYLVTSLFTTAAFGSSAAVASDQPDLILTSNHVVTMTGSRSAEPLAVAIRGERISWVGPIEEIVHSDARIINLGDRALLPGFIDAHGHAAYLAMTTQLANIAAPPVGPVEDVADLQSVLRQYIKDKALQPGEWVVGQGYDDSLLAENRHPTRDDLDAVSTEHPIYLVHVSGHLAAANSSALEIAGITAESDNPPGGVIRRRAGSEEPNGVLEESASYPLRQYMTAPVKDPLQSIQAAMAAYASYGITTAQDGAASLESIQLLQAADASDLVNLDVIMYPAAQRKPQEMMDLEYGVYKGRVKLGGVKLMLDGSPQGKTAYMTEPYLKPPHGQSEDYRGYPAISQVRANELVAQFGDAGIKMLAHANGDAAADMLINAVRAAKLTSDHRTVMIHAQTVREDQLTDMKTLNMIPSFFSAHSFYWGDWHRDSVFGHARAMRISPTASTVARDMVFTLHNDAPIVPPDMIRLLWATTNRLTRSGQVLGANQRISTYDAIRGITSHAAYQHFEEADKGTIEIGKLADLVVLSQNPLSVPTAQLMNIQVEATYSRGKPIFQR